ncbi:MAG: hypothetical protein F6K18_11035 [Okeania sp. SIO2C2]|nr:hypothetical protein [Okeania sp. SIO2C2]
MNLNSLGVRSQESGVRREERIRNRSRSRGAWNGVLSRSYLDMISYLKSPMPIIYAFADL